MSWDPLVASGVREGRARERERCGFVKLYSVRFTLDGSCWASLVVNWLSAFW